MKRGVRVCVALIIVSVIGVVSPGGALGKVDTKSRITEFSNGSTGAIGSPDQSDTAGAVVAGPDGNVWFTEFSAGISPGAYPSGITVGPDGNLWFTESARRTVPMGITRSFGRIGRITPDGVITEFTAGLTIAPSQITAGPDGNLWFTGSIEDADRRSLGLIGRIIPDGVITEFSTGLTPYAGVYGITAGPDGNVWFTESVSETVG